MANQVAERSQPPVVHLELPARGAAQNRSCFEGLARRIVLWQQPESSCGKKTAAFAIRLVTFVICLISVFGIIPWIFADREITRISYDRALRRPGGEIANLEVEIANLEVENRRLVLVEQSYNDVMEAGRQIVEEGRRAQALSPAAPQTPVKEQMELDPFAVNSHTKRFFKKALGDGNPKLEVSVIKVEFQKLAKPLQNILREALQVEG